MAVIKPYHLLDQASRLLSKRTASGSTIIRQADRRRAISAAYYAVFHTIVTAFADEYIGHDDQGDKRSPSGRYGLAYRRIDHAQLASLAKEVGKLAPERKYQPYWPDAGFDPSFREAASLIVALRDKRHSADYDPCVWIEIADARNAIADARLAIESFVKAPEEQRKLFLTLLAFPPR